MNGLKERMIALQASTGLILPPNFLGRGTDEWLWLLHEDKYLNNVTLREWDSMAYQLVAIHNISLADSVCLLKHCVRTQVCTTQVEESIYPYVIVVQGAVDNYYYRLLLPDGSYAPLSFTKEGVREYIKQLQSEA